MMMVALALSLAVWLGGTLALMTKGTLALVVGKKVMAGMPPRFTRTVASSAYCILGILSVAKTIAPVRVV